MGTHNSLTAIDIFAGLGGMSLGAMKAGFNVRAAVEIDAAAARTYEKNHSGTHVVQKDVRAVSGEDLRKLAGLSELHLLMGCAPCQGFSSLTSKYRREDSRNMLVLELARLAEELKPDCIVMENVPGLAQKGKPLLDELLLRLHANNYETISGVLQMADFGVPQRRRRFVLIASRGVAPTLPRPTHVNPVHARDSNLPSWRTVRHVLPGLGSPEILPKALKKGGPQRFNWHVVSSLSERTKARLRDALPGESRLDINPDLLPDCHRDGYKGFSNVYTRMHWDEPSPTITAGCLTPAKGRFGHPDRRRWTLSLREAARLQTIPDSFQIATDRMEHACQMIGNAVPPLFAEVLFKHIANTIFPPRKSMSCQTSLS